MLYPPQGHDLTRLRDPAFHIFGFQVSTQPEAESYAYETIGGSVSGRLDRTSLGKIRPW